MKNIKTIVTAVALGSVLLCGSVLAGYSIDIGNCTYHDQTGDVDLSGRTVTVDREAISTGGNEFPVTILKDGSPLVYSAITFTNQGTRSFPHIGYQPVTFQASAYGPTQHSATCKNVRVYWSGHVVG